MLTYLIGDIDITEYIIEAQFLTRNFKIYTLYSLGISEEFVGYNIIHKTLSVYSDTTLLAECIIDYSTVIYYVGKA